MSPTAPESLPSRPAPTRLILLGAAFLPLLALLAWQAWRTYWQCDDAFISYRYVRNFIEGHGLVFNRGERVEGYTNFLWVLELSALWKVFSLRPEVGSNILSAIYTAGSVLLTVALAWSGPFRERRAFVAWGALLLLGVSHSWAVWSTSGLETRQFTFFVLLSIVCLSGYPRGRGRLLSASLSLAACEYTRPEGTLIFGCCLAWLIVDSLIHDRFRMRDVLTLSVPFVLLVGLHYGWRLSYYGDVWPNTYYAKHVRPWPEAGFRYMALAVCEFGLYATVPAALLGTLVRLRRGDWTHLLSLSCLVPHAFYLIRIGGDHFEFRVLDFYWPLLAVAAVEGVVALARWFAGLLRSWESHQLLADAAALCLLGVVAVYAAAVEVAKDLVTNGLTTRDETLRLKVQIRREEIPSVFVLPGMSGLIAKYNSLYAFCSQHGIAAPHVEHRAFWRQEVKRWSPYEELHGKDIFPPDTVTTFGSIGVSCFYLADLTAIDSRGLTDRYVARMPVAKSNEQRYIAHDHDADWPYLFGRGLNLILEPPAKSSEEALASTNYALRIRDDMWIPFDSFSHEWVERAFRSRSEVRTWKVLIRLGCLADGDLAGWVLEGPAFQDQPRFGEGQRSILPPIRRCDGEMWLDTRSRTPGESATGRALSPLFRVPHGGSLEFLLGGTKGAEVGVQLLRGGTAVRTWRALGKPTPRRFDLSAWEGGELQVCVFDKSGEEGGYVLAADLVVLEPVTLNRP